ncbi:sugar-binding domain-containing protein [Aquimarina algiphila]|uniref:Glycoside hydrolase family 2 protein n=1 Tax=Aquimarina algiphila TaxID=2047982 RepID=A0A554VD38_9FLAO|nr:sugar-binding domain-containing protein [Aquimarina algiphila]TSE04718.1 glycoside hydrolase family 2 protein [Aquimarina algiphila]
MRLFYLLLSILSVFSSCTNNNEGISRVIEDFNYDWRFYLGDEPEAYKLSFNDTNWTVLNVPHDWSIEEGYQKEGETAASSGFVPGGIGWYRKSFLLTEADKNKQISIQFDGVYNNSTVWINGKLLGTRPNGYISFIYDLTPHLKYDGTPNMIAVKVDHSAYVDSRWYTGSGIYRNVKLIKTGLLHIDHWGVQITTPKVSKELAEINIKTILKNAGEINDKEITLDYLIVDENNVAVARQRETIDNKSLSDEVTIQMNTPKLWSIETPNLYTLKVEVYQDDVLVDDVSETFGIRTFNFDANTGFSLNGKHMKIKGVNLHHDAGAVGAAVPKSIWEYRMKKLKSIGTNAIRFAHNPHSPELLEVCDELGLLVMNEAFDEWSEPKAKSKVYLGDNAASKEASKAYPEVFNEWAERDLKDLIRRDFNHPSVFMWSIGNEIEWTYPHYSETFNEVNPNSSAAGYQYVPVYDAKKIAPVFEKNIDSIDPLVTIAKKLVKWVKEEDDTRPTVCGSVLPSIGMVSGYGTAMDVYGFNYRQADYDIAHQTYPDLKILGSENWGTYSEWKEVIDRDFVAGIFAWTGFAYMGEAGPWPRKGLNISFFDFAGFKTPRGHFFETLWKKEPKVYMVTTPNSESEFSYTEKDGWKFEMQLTPPPVWNMLRLWEWYKVYPKWNYKNDEAIIVQAYTNCEEAELFLNGTSLGKQKLADVVEDDHILKWLVPYTDGELKIIGYNNGIKADEYSLTSQKEISKIEITTNKTTIDADGYDVAVIEVKLLDQKGTLITDNDTKITFSIEGEGKNIGVDNGWEMNTQPHKTNEIITHNGKAVLYVQSTKNNGNINIKALVYDKNIENEVTVVSN